MPKKELIPTIATPLILSAATPALAQVALPPGPSDVGTPDNPATNGTLVESVEIPNVDTTGADPANNFPAAGRGVVNHRYNTDVFCPPTLHPDGSFTSEWPCITDQPTK